MARFSEIPLFILEDYLGKLLIDPTEEPDYSGISGSGVTLFKANHAFITKDLRKFDFYAKSEDSDYEKIKADIRTDWNSEYNRIILHKLLSLKVVKSSDIKRTVQESGYRRVTYDAINADKHGYEYSVEQGDGIYIRKDHDFVKWLRENSDLYDGFVNKEQPYIYIGNGYQFHNTLIKIYYYALKDWMKDALPANNRTDKFSTFIDLIYDRLYSKLYNMQKNLLSLIDPKEIDESFVDNLYSYYSVDPLLSSIDIYKERLFIDNLIYFLKKKGTYPSIYIIWKILSANTENEITVYDRWHRAFQIPAEGETYPSPYEYFEDYPYINYYGVGNYPSNYVDDYEQESTTSYEVKPFSLQTFNNAKFEERDADYIGSVLSTHYKVEFDLNHNPLQDGYILSKNMANDLHRLWESTRPINRVSHYHVLVNPIGNFTIEETKLYNNPIYDANIYSKSNIYALATHDDAYATLQTVPSNVWNITHNLGTRNVIVSIYNNQLQKIQPNIVKTLNENELVVNFGRNNVSGVVMVLRADRQEYQDYILESWIVNHNLDNTYIIPQMYDRSFIQAKPREVEILDNNKFKIVDGFGNAVVADTSYLHTQSYSANVWTIEHNLNNNGVIVSVFDKYGYKIIPDQISLDTYNKCTITLNDSTEGYAAVRAIGNINTMPLENNFEGQWYVKIGSGENLEDWDTRLENDIKKEDYRLELDADNFEADTDGFHFKFNIPRNKEGYITEIGIFDIHESLIFASRIDNLYKHRDFILEIDFLAEY